MRSLTFLLILAATVICGHAQDSQSVKPQELTPSQRAAREELNRAAAAYKAGDFVEAQRHSENALSLDPENRTAPIFVARTIHVQYLIGVYTPENAQIARAAIAAYQRVLSYLPMDEESYKAVAALYSALKEDQLLRDWLMQRAINPNVHVEKRAEAYAVLAGKDWDCSFKITELPENKLVSEEGQIFYTKPKSENDFQRANECVTRGLEMVETAIVFDPDCENAWTYKMNLLLERSKLAEMDGRHEAKLAYRNAADEAKSQAAIVTGKRRQREEEGQNDDSESQNNVPETAPESKVNLGGVKVGRVPIERGELDNVAVKKPLPPYPPAARSAGIGGSVRVAVVVDEAGRVISALAVDGHSLLQNAAVAAARHARFSPVYHDGQPVRVRGFLTYEFPSR